MTYGELYFTNIDWEPSTVLEINPGKVNNSEELTAYTALVKYLEYKVVGFSLNWVLLRASD